MTTSDVTARPTSRLTAEGLRVGYGRHLVLDGVDFSVLEGELTVILGPNACGKSTLLRALARMISPDAGRVVLDGEDLHQMRTRNVALKLGLLPQSPQAPEGMVVRELVGRGRFPHQSLLQQWSLEDDRIVEAAMRRARVDELADRSVDALSGGQRQRVWIAMALAQDTGLLFMDEPTTFLDVVHQIEVLDLAASLRDEGRTVVLVLHDLNLALRYATHVVFVCDGGIVAQGHPAEIVDEALLKRVYDLEALVFPCPATGRPLVVPEAPRRPLSRPEK